MVQATNYNMPTYPGDPQERLERLKRIMANPRDDIFIQIERRPRGGEAPQTEPAKCEIKPTEAELKPKTELTELHVVGCEVDHSPRIGVRGVHYDLFRIRPLSYEESSELDGAFLEIQREILDFFRNVHRSGGSIDEAQLRDLVERAIEAWKKPYLKQEETHGLFKDFEDRAIHTIVTQVITLNIQAASETMFIRGGGRAGDSEVFIARYYFQANESREVLFNFFRNFAKEQGHTCHIDNSWRPEIIFRDLLPVIGSGFDFPPGFVPDRDLSIIHDKRSASVTINGRKVCLLQAGRMNTTAELREHLLRLGVNFNHFSSVRFLSDHFNILTRGHPLHTGPMNVTFATSQAYEAYLITS